jgi:hypothetical protein
MTLLSLAAISDLEVRLGLSVGDLQDANLARAQAALDDTSALVRAEAGKTWLDAGGLTVTAPAEVITIVIKATLREYKNPDSFTSEQLGDYSYRTDAVGGVYLTEDERRIIRAASGTASHGLWTVRTPSAYNENPSLGVNYYMPSELTAGPYEGY